MAQKKLNGYPVLNPFTLQTLQILLSFLKLFRRYDREFSHGKIDRLDLENKSTDSSGDEHGQQRR
ncbi:hypothetical protein ACU36R_03475 [Pectobacterium brasiliense]|uniref:hypothetical protein n=1 Tax=Pectobacterium brasiliense TaxID=180957 RepID=UPI00406C4297